MPELLESPERVPTMHPRLLHRRHPRGRHDWRGGLAIEMGADALTSARRFIRIRRWVRTLASQFCMASLNGSFLLAHATEYDSFIATNVTTLKTRLDAVQFDTLSAPFLRGDGGDDHWLVADDGGPVAVAYFTTERMTEGTWNLLLIAVLPTMQSQGIGAALMRSIEADLAARGQRVLLVETSGLPQFARTRAFYLRDGYEEEARIRDFYQAGEDKVIFRKLLLG